MLPTARRLDDHIRQAEKRHDETILRIKDLSDQTRGEFEQVNKEQDRMHSENTAKFDKISKTIYIATGIAMAIGITFSSRLGEEIITKIFH